MDLLIPGSGLIFWQALAFLALILLLGKLAWKPILSALEEREQSITSALEAAETAKAEMARLKADNEKLLEEARLERDRILRDAREAARRFEDEEKAKVGVTTARMLDEARQAIQNEEAAALTDVRNQVAQLSLEITEKLLRTKLAEEPSQRALVNEFLKDLKLN